MLPKSNSNRHFGDFLSFTRCIVQSEKNFQDGLTNYAVGSGESWTILGWPSVQDSIFYLGMRTSKNAACLHISSKERTHSRPLLALIASKTLMASRHAVGEISANDHHIWISVSRDHNACRCLHIQWIFGGTLALVFCPRAQTVTA